MLILVTVVNKCIFYKLEVVVLIWIQKLKNSEHYQMVGGFRMLTDTANSTLC